MNLPSRWLRPLFRSADPDSAQLVLCPHGGASQGSFRGWQGSTPAQLSASLVIYPGRDHRLQEPCMRDIEGLALHLADALEAQAYTSPWILAGHSMGAQIAFEACHLLEQHGRAPSGLILSACHAPHLEPRRRLSQLDDDRFIEQLARFGGCPADLQTDPDFRAFYLPMLRNDFAASETYHRPLAPDRGQVGIPTLLLYGTADEDARGDDLLAWQPWLKDQGALQALTGGHFYVTQRPGAFIAQVSRMLNLPLEPPAHVIARDNPPSHHFP